MGTVRGRERPRPPARRAGFTLIETALTTVIIGVGILALLEAQQAFLRTNAWSTQSATAAYLANEIRELTRRLPRHDPVTGLTLQTGASGSTLHGWGPEAGEVTVQDFDDIDDFDGITFRPDGTLGLADHDLPGPIDAFGNVIPEILPDGSALLDSSGNPVPLQGWTQSVRVEKVDPFDFSTVHPHAYWVPGNGADFDGIPVDRFPLRVTVDVAYQGPFDTAPSTVMTVVWVVP